MAVVELSIVPVGTGSTSISSYVKQAVSILKEKGLKYEVTPMGTVIEGDLEEVLEVCKQIHRSVLSSGVNRSITTIKIDDRKDKELTMESKVAAVEHD
ncbi:MAG: MTH1187 family thiamine-binding protein [Archaeoglobaceae archaeon]